MLHDALVALAFPFVFLLAGAAQWCIIDFLYRRDKPWPPMEQHTTETLIYGTTAAAQPQWNYACIISGQLSQAAHDKALDLLREWLTPAQLADFKAHNYFFVYGNATGTRYRIRLADSFFNVDEMNTDNSIKQRLCFVCENQVAPGDTMLAQKVMLEQNELHALQIANKSLMPGMPRPPESHYEHFYG